MRTTVGADRLAGTRVLHVTESAIGGVDLVLELMYQVGQAHGVVDHFILPHDSELRVASPATVQSFRLRRGLRVFNVLPLLGLTLLACLRVRPQVIWLHSTFAGLLRVFLWPLRLFGVRIVYCPHGWGMDRPRSAWVVGAIEWLLSWFGSAIHCISGHELSLGLRIGVPRRKLFLLVNALPESLTTGATASKGDRGALQALFVGRLDHQKGLDRLLHAYAQVERSDLHLTVIGDFIQDRNPVLAGQIRHMQDEGRLSWLGWQPRSRILERMSASDCVLIPSRWEGFGLVAIESLSTGTPVIAARVGGLGEIISPDVGWLIESEDELRDRLRELSVAECHRRSADCLQRFRSEYSQSAYAHRYGRALVALLHA